MLDDDSTVLDIVLAARRIGRFAENVNEADFLADEEKQWAIVSQLMVIGEAVRRLSEGFRDKHPDTPWRQMSGMRDRLIHQYDKINWSLVWATVTRDVPALLQILEPLVPERSSKAAEQGKVERDTGER